MLTPHFCPVRRPLVRSVSARVLIALASVSALAFGHSVIAQEAPGVALPGPPISTTPVALVIANSPDNGGNGAKNQETQAHAIETALKQRGFTVFLRLNRTRGEMESDIEAFAKAATHAKTALVYYSGQATQDGGENFLVPASCSISRNSGVQKNAVSFRHIMNAVLAADSPEKVVIVNASRFEATNSSLMKPAAFLVATDPGAVGAPHTFIAFATAPGKRLDLPGYDRGVDLFTQKLLAELLSPERDFEKVLLATGKEVAAASNGTQDPWIRSNVKDHSDVFRREDYALGRIQPLQRESYRSDVEIGYGDAVNAMFTAPTTESIVIPDSLKSTAYDVVVGVRVQLLATGMIRVQLTRNSGYPALDEAVRQVCLTMKFKPAMQDGKAVDDTERFNFHLVNKG